VAAVAVEERRLMLRCAARLESAGVAPPELSVGSTPTVLAATDLGGMSEVRPGNYAFFDAFQVAIGSCRLSEVAFSVLVTVIGHFPDRGELVIDGGALALSKDPGPVQVDPACGYGVILEPSGRRRLAGLKVVSLSQEHGVVRAERRSDLERVALGETLRIVPNHSCLSAALFDRYHVLSDGEVVDEWRPLRGW
jgi:D-serine deaminase-like pyridoxal phosphate-dependent protein